MESLLGKELMGSPEELQKIHLNSCVLVNVGFEAGVGWLSESSDRFTCLTNISFILID